VFRLWWGGGAAGDGCFSVAGSWHWLLFVVTALASGGDDSQEEQCRICIVSVRASGLNRSTRLRGLGSYVGPLKNKS
jgi:hypothetical protein